MAGYFVQGNLGAGKTLTAIYRAHDYIARGRIVATNINLNLSVLAGHFDQSSEVYRLPDRPTLADLEMLPVANLEYDESLNGALILDECIDWFSSRSWNERGRAELGSWLRHSRKLGWDLYVLGQSVESLDASARRELMEHTVSCKRMDRMAVPVVGAAVFLATLGQYRIELPRVHLATVRYVPTDQRVLTWTFRGDQFFKAYDTKQIFDPNGPNQGVSRLLPGAYFRPKSLCVKNGEFYMRLSSLYFRRLQSFAWLSLALLFFVATYGISAYVYVATLPPDIEPIAEPTRERVLTDASKRQRSMLIHSNLAIERTDRFGVGRRPVAEPSLRPIAGVVLTDGTLQYPLIDLAQAGYQVAVYSSCYMTASNSVEFITARCSLPSDKPAKVDSQPVADSRRVAFSG